MPYVPDRPGATDGLVALMNEAPISGRPRAVAPLVTFTTPQPFWKAEPPVSWRATEALSTELPVSAKDRTDTSPQNVVTLIEPGENTAPEDLVVSSRS